MTIFEYFTDNDILSDSQKQLYINIFSIEDFEIMRNMLKINFKNQIIFDEDTTSTSLVNLFYTKKYEYERLKSSELEYDLLNSINITENRASERLFDKTDINSLEASGTNKNNNTVNSSSTDSKNTYNNASFTDYQKNVGISSNSGDNVSNNNISENNKSNTNDKFNESVNKTGRDGDIEDSLKKYRENATFSLLEKVCQDIIVEISYCIYN